jgi:hypothetical protein
MAGFGFGYGPARATRTRPPTTTLAGIVPGQNWTGIAGSGHQPAPVDPVRVTAKPAMRLLIPPYQVYTNRLVVGVYAGANNGGTLIDNMGLEKVVAHYEGKSVEITEPSLQSFTDANGNAVTYLGWWIELRRDGRDGEAHLYFEAVPKDPTFQRRVMGPYSFFPRDEMNDYSVSVEPSHFEIPGVRYQSVTAALAYMRFVGANHPLITIAEPGSYDILNTGSPTYLGAGCCTITASVPVTIGKSAYTNDSDAIMRINYEGLRFLGGNITFDLKNISYMRNEGLRDVWFDGVKFINSDGRYHLWRKGKRPIPQFGDGSPWYTECDFFNVSYAACRASLLRGSKFREGFNDVATDGACVIGNHVDDWDSTPDWHKDVDAMTVRYVGPEATATLALVGGNDVSSVRTLTARWGANSATFQVSAAEVYYIAGTNYDVSDVVNWLNGLGAGFEATLIDDSRRASALSLPGLKGIGFGEVSVKNTTLMLVTEFDVHADFWQQNSIAGGGIVENVVIADNTVVGMVGQDIFIKGADGAKDFLVLNNAFWNKIGDSVYATNSTTASQVQQSHSHVVIAHNTWASQQFNLRTTNTYNPDANCLFANNVVRRINWLGPVDTDLKVVDNHIFAGWPIPAGSTGTTIGGDYDTLFVDAPNGNFTLTALLQNQLRPARVSYNRFRAKREPQAAPGCI